MCTGVAGGCFLRGGSTCIARYFATDTRAPALCVYVCVAPGNCDASTSVGTYYRKHNPLISFDSVRNNATRCAKIVNSDQLDKDLAGTVHSRLLYVSCCLGAYSIECVSAGRMLLLRPPLFWFPSLLLCCSVSRFLCCRGASCLGSAGTLPNWSYYTPDINNDAHNTKCVRRHAATVAVVLVLTVVDSCVHLAPPHILHVLVAPELIFVVCATPPSTYSVAYAGKWLTSFLTPRLSKFPAKTL